MRTILAALILLCLIVISACADDQDRWVKLFNGKDLTGWDCDESYWSVRDGAITGETTPGHLLKGYNTFCVYAEKEPEDFQLRLKYKIVGGNSGVQYRSVKPQRRRS